MITNESIFGPLSNPIIHDIYEVKSTKQEEIYKGSKLLDFHFSYIVNLDQSMIFIDRSVYNLFDFIRDLGGLMSGLNGLALITVSILKYQDFQFYMVSKLYTKE